jgi:hypothetical protein
VPVAAGAWRAWWRAWPTRASQAQVKGWATRLWRMVKSLIFSVRSAREVNSSRSSSPRVSTEINHSSAMSSHEACTGLQVTAGPGAAGDPGASGPGDVAGSVVHDQVDVRVRGDALVQPRRNGVKVTESLRAIGPAITWPVAASNAAMIETVPLRMYSNSRRAPRPRRAAPSGYLRCLACGTFSPRVPAVVRRSRRWTSRSGVGAPEVHGCWWCNAHGQLRRAVRAEGCSTTVSNLRRRPGSPG